jgi:hypothetical protein
MSTTDPLLAPISGANHREMSGVHIDVVGTGAARVKRLIYPAGFRWSTHIKPFVGTESCMHGHVGFLARGHIHIQYTDGCSLDLTAPQVLAIEPGHDGWVVGEEPAVVVEFDFERDTVQRLGMSPVHQHLSSKRE